MLVNATIFPFLLISFVVLVDVRHYFVNLKVFGSAESNFLTFCQILQSTIFFNIKFCSFRKVTSFNLISASFYIFLY